MTITEAARLIGKSEQSVRRAIKAGKLKAEMVNGRYEIDRDDIADSPISSQMIVTDSQGGDSLSDSQAIVKENEYLKQRVSDLEADRERLQAALEAKDKQIQNLQEQLAEASERHDTVVMQLTRLVSWYQQPLWRRLFSRKALPPRVDETIMDMETEAKRNA